MIPCNQCHQCNTKGKPSVSRGSKYCDEHIISIKRNNSFLNIILNFKDKLFNKRFDEKTKSLKTTKGFRESWFYR